MPWKLTEWIAFDGKAVVAETEVLIETFGIDGVDLTLTRMRTW
jgi:chitinase